MSGSVDKIERIFLAIVIISHSHGSELYRNTPLPLDIHAVEKLFFRVPLSHRLRDVHNTVRKRAFAMVDVSYDTKISDM